MVTQSEERASYVKEQAPRRKLTGIDRDRKVLENNLLQFDRMIQLIDEQCKSQFFRIQPWMIQELNRIAIDGLDDAPGSFRQKEMGISGSAHEPPKWQDVPKHIDEMCAYVNDHWTKSAVHLASYLMWRLNWIHPFTDGNGRTARASYFIFGAFGTCRSAFAWQDNDPG